MSRRLQDVGLLLLALVAAAMVALALRHVATTPDSAASGALPEPATQTVASPGDVGATSSGDQGEQTETSGPTGGRDDPVDPAVDPLLDQAREILADESPVVLSVLGDATSNARQEWVHRWATRLAEERPVTISHWDEASEEGFVEPDVLSQEGVGTGSAMTIWSGSASGADAAYPASRVEAMMPEKPDLLVLNFGHSDPPGRVAARLGVTWEAVQEAYGTVPVVVILQQPEADDANAATREAVADWAREQGLPTIDVASDFLAEPDYADLLLSEDGVTPNDEGSQRWADLVARALTPGP